MGSSLETLRWMRMHGSISLTTASLRLRCFLLGCAWELGYRVGACILGLGSWSGPEADTPIAPLTLYACHSSMVNLNTWHSYMMHVNYRPNSLMWKEMYHVLLKLIIAKLVMFY